MYAAGVAGIRLFALAGVAAATVTSAAAFSEMRATAAAESKPGGVFRISMSTADVDSMDPALTYSSAAWDLLDVTCARLMSYPDKAPPAGNRLVPEIAA